MQASVHARIIAIGSELLDGDRPDTNSRWIAARLGSLGVSVRGITAIPDDEESIASEVRSARAAPITLVCGGLGPTADDRTREGIALALGRPLSRHPVAEAAVRARLESRGQSPSPDQLRQADLPEGGEPLENPVGIAPGFLVRDAGQLLFALPGVPAELMALFDSAVEPVVRAGSSGFLVRRVLKVAGRSESAVDQQLRDLFEQTPSDWSLLAGERGVEVVLRGRGASDARERMDVLEAEVRRRLGPDLYGSGSDTLPAIIGGILAERSATVGCAESCTGGLLCAALINPPGASRWFRGGLVLYADNLKRVLASVPDGVIASSGAVSEPVALCLASAARTQCRADYGIGVTGIAGPAGGSAEKPVGLVHIAIAGPAGSQAWRSVLPGDRGAIRGRAVTFALDRLRRFLLNLP